MPINVFSASVFGFDCKTIEVEVDILNGLASITIVGLGDTSVQEAKERIRSAIKNSGMEYPRRKKVINLAPADIPKHGPAFDLPIALGLLMQSEQLPQDALKDTIVIGELALDGRLRKVPGVLAMVSHAKEKGFLRAIIPQQNAQEATVIGGIEILAAEDLRSVVVHLRGEEKIKPAQIETTHAGLYEHPYSWNFEDIYGHENAKRALIIAATGKHNLLLYGPPGSGKTMLALSMQSILPQLTLEESIEVTKIYSIANRLQPNQSLIRTPPFRSVHHTAGPIALVGGGQIPKPGEISLAHRGILFLDELLEFQRGSLDSLRQPMESGEITISRAKASAVFPARFMLIAATNPCPCGYSGDPAKACKCTPSQMQQYNKKLSGPLLDRIDLVCSVPRLPFEKIATLKGTDSSGISKKRVAQARQTQHERFKNYGSAAFTNGEASSSFTRKHFVPEESAQKLLKDAFAQSHYSGRAYFRILKVSRTIADLEGSTEIKANHVAEALQYRLKFDQENA